MRRVRTSSSVSLAHRSWCAYKEDARETSLERPNAQVIRAAQVEVRDFHSAARPKETVVGSR